VAAVAQELNAHVAYASGSGPRVADVVAGLREAGAGHVTVATYLLADGLFYRTLHNAGADVVTEPLVTSAAVVDLVLSRYLTTADVPLTEEMNPRVMAGRRGGNSRP
jgi:sirohydrochlorin ferrochelatase